MVSWPYSRAGGRPLTQPTTRRPAPPARGSGWRLPPLGWSSWYGYTSNINEALILGIAEGLTAPRVLRNGSSVSLASVGFRHVWIDDGWALPRDPVTSKITVDPTLFPSGFRNLSDALHAQGLFFGVYTDEGPLTVRAAATAPHAAGECDLPPSQPLHRARQGSATSSLTLALPFPFLLAPVPGLPAHSAKAPRELRL